MSVVNWVIDSLASEDVIDLYFILSDLKDIPISEAEQCETAYFDAMSGSGDAGRGRGGDVPIGKQVY